MVTPLYCFYDKSVNDDMQILAALPILGMSSLEPQNLEEGGGGPI